MAPQGSKPLTPTEPQKLSRTRSTCLEEARQMALVHYAFYQQTLHRYHERKVRGRTLEVGNLVLRRVQSTKDRHKLTPRWEGPYKIVEVVQPGTYRLKDSDGNILTNTWNIK
jgi:hypothetical protein